MFLLPLTDAALGPSRRREPVWNELLVSVPSSQSGDVILEHYETRETHLVIDAVGDRSKAFCAMSTREKIKTLYLWLWVFCCDSSCGMREASLISTLVIHQFPFSPTGGWWLPLLPSFQRFFVHLHVFSHIIFSPHQTQRHHLSICWKIKSRRHIMQVYRSAGDAPGDYAGDLAKKKL